MSDWTWRDVLRDWSWLDTLLLPAAISAVALLFYAVVQFYAWVGQ
jgi:hypothetical protein